MRRLSLLLWCLGAAAAVATMCIMVGGGRCIIETVCSIIIEIACALYVKHRTLSIHVYWCIDYIIASS